MYSYLSTRTSQVLFPTMYYEYKNNFCISTTTYAFAQAHAQAEVEISRTYTKKTSLSPTRKQIHPAKSVPHIWTEHKQASKQAHVI